MIIIKKLIMRFNALKLLVVNIAASFDKIIVQGQFSVGSIRMNNVN